MKKIILVIAVLFFYIGGYAQVNVNVRIYGGNQRLYFKHPHAWMVNHGYHYHRGGYYVRRGVKVYPVRREYYNPGRGHGYHKNYGHKYHKRHHGHKKGR